jgi:hypothetical protein
VELCGNSSGDCGEFVHKELLSEGVREEEYVDLKSGVLSKKSNIGACGLPLADGIASLTSSSSSSLSSSSSSVSSSFNEDFCQEEDYRFQVETFRNVLTRSPLITEIEANPPNLVDPLLPHEGCCTGV